MVIKSVNLETVCGITSKIPDNLLDEVAFAGKSNVGKSSLINTLMNRKSLARISAQPGKTQTINFYNINDAMYLVDLPGYGYANARVEIKAKWGQMIENYLHVSRRLKAVFLLVDIRHEPSENDQMMYDWILHQGYEPVIIATKADKIKRSRLNQHLQVLRDGLQLDREGIVIPFSAETKQGREEIWKLIESLVDLPENLQDNHSEKMENEGNASKIGTKDTISETETGKKKRWKSTDRPVAKKTLRKAQAKKAQTKNAKGKKKKS